MSLPANRSEPAAAYAPRIALTPVTPAQLRALAHPLRIQLLQLLRAEGPSTASALGRRLGESSGATSYHLRALHRAGMVEEDEQRNGRERWWRIVAERTVIPTSIPADATPAERAELEAAHAQLESVFLGRDEDALSRWSAIRYDLPLEWQDASWLINFRVWGTPQELETFALRVREALEDLRKPPDAPSPDVREVHVTLRVLPQDVDPTP